MFDFYDDVLNVEESCKAMKMGKKRMYEMLRQGTIKSIKIGNKYLVPKVFLEDYINEIRQGLQKGQWLDIIKQSCII